MFGILRVAILGVVVAGMATAYAVRDRSQRPVERSDTGLTAPRKSVDGDKVRDAERSRRAQRPKSDPTRTNRFSYDEVLAGRNFSVKDQDRTPSKPSPAKRMPATSCRSVEPAPKSRDEFTGPERVHRLTTAMFESASGFGFGRLAMTQNSRGILVPSRSIDRIELVSLLTEYEPSVYVLDEMATPALARQAKRRPLDEFEERGLEAVRKGESLVWTREAPTRMFGAIRAKKTCLECHVEAKEGELLGAFTYYLTTGVDQLVRSGQE